MPNCTTAGHAPSDFESSQSAACARSKCLTKLSTAEPALADETGVFALLDRRSHDEVAGVYPPKALKAAGLVDYMKSGSGVIHEAILALDPQ